MSTTDDTTTSELELIVRGGCVRYGRLFNRGNYENERFEIELPIEANETPEQAMERAKAFVAAQNRERMADEAAERRKLNLQNDIYTAEQRLRHVTRAWTDAYTKFDELRALLEKHGVAIDPLDGYYRPKAEGAVELEEADDDDEDYEDMDDGPDNSM